MTPAELPAVQQHARAQLLAYIGLLDKWNRVYNLTAIRQPEQMVTRHLLDSLILRSWLPRSIASAPQNEDHIDVLDIGSGAGLPVLPLAIVHPELTFMSVESNGKKTRFQQQVILELGLQNVTIVNRRVEHISASARFVTSRAFTAPVEFLNIVKPLCADNAVVAIMLGLAERLPRVLPQPFQLEELVEVDIPGTESSRHVALCRRSAA